MDIFDDMDTATAALIVRLQLEDSEEQFESLVGKGKAREGGLSDAQFALQLYKEDLERNVAIVADEQMSRNIARACILDGEIVIATMS